MSDQINIGKGIELEPDISLDMDYMSDILLMAMLKHDIRHEEMLAELRHQNMCELEPKIAAAERKLLTVTEESEEHQIISDELDGLKDQYDGEEYWFEDSHKRMELTRKKLEEVSQVALQKQLAKKNYRR